MFNLIKNIWDAIKSFFSWFAVLPRFFETAIDILTAIITKITYFLSFIPDQIYPFVIIVVVILIVKKIVGRE